MRIEDTVCQKTESGTTPPDCQYSRLDSCPAYLFPFLFAYDMVEDFALCISRGRIMDFCGLYCGAWWQ